MRDASAAGKSVNITQGEFAIMAERDGIITTILGSCVACCMWDAKAGVGGMNHILVAQSGSGATRNDFAGVNAMELVINGLIRRGASRDNLQAKVFGGAKMIEGLSDIGQVNGAFVVNFLEREGIPCLGQSIGGTLARQIRFYAGEGRVLQKSIAAAEAPPPPPRPARVTPPAGNDMELF